MDEFFHPKSSNWNVQILVMVPQLPSPGIQRLLLDTKFETKLVYLQGSCLLDDDLWRANADKASAVFIFCDVNDSNHEEQDVAVNLITTSLRYFRHDLPIFAQVIKSQSVKHVLLSGASDVLCLEQFKFQLLAANCLIPGLNAFIQIL